MAPGILGKQDKMQDLEIPPQSRIVRALGLRGWDPTLDPGQVLAFQAACQEYEDHLMAQASAALQVVLSNRRRFRYCRFVPVKVDLSRTSAGGEVAFHVAHYGFQPPTSDGETAWSRRAPYCWQWCGVRHPFRAVQERLWEQGYALVDMSFMGSGTRFRLYFRGPPSRADYVAAVRQKYPLMTPDDITDRHWFWHGLHRIPAQVAALQDQAQDTEASMAAAAAGPGASSSADDSGNRCTA